LKSAAGSELLSVIRGSEVACKAGKSTASYSDRFMCPGIQMEVTSQSIAVRECRIITLDKYVRARGLMDGNKDLCQIFSRKKCCLKFILKERAFILEVDNFAIIPEYCPPV